MHTIHPIHTAATALAEDHTIPAMVRNDCRADGVILADMLRQAEALLAKAKRLRKPSWRDACTHKAGMAVAILSKANADWQAAHPAIYAKWMAEREAVQ